MVDADQRRHVLGQTFRQPVHDAASGPVFARTGRGQHFHGRAVALGLKNAQALQAGFRCFRARVVDADVAAESGRVQTGHFFLHALDTLAGALMAEAGFSASMAASLTPGFSPR